MLYRNEKPPSPEKPFLLHARSGRIHRLPFGAGLRSTGAPSAGKTPCMAKRSLKPDPAGTLMQLKVTLEGRPSIWRRLLVPADIKLSEAARCACKISMGLRRKAICIASAMST